MFSVIIVNWNTKELTKKCIESVQRYCSDYELILIDNASTDGSVELFREMSGIIFVTNKQNVGYARANNQGIAIAKGDYILLLNSDAELTQYNLFAILQEKFEQNPKLGILGAKLVYPNGKIQSLGRSFLSLKKIFMQQILFSSAFKVQNNINDKLITVDYVDGAFLAIPKRIIDQIGLLNEDYFMYAEDMEWCLRAAQKSFFTAVLSDIHVIHHHGASSKKDFNKILVENACNNSAFIYKYDSRQKAKIAFFLYMIGMLLRVPLSIIRRNGLAKDYYVGMQQCLKLVFNGKRPWQK